MLGANITFFYSFVLQSISLKFRIPGNLRKRVLILLNRETQTLCTVLVVFFVRQQTETPHILT